MQRHGTDNRTRAEWQWRRGLFQLRLLASLVLIPPLAFLPLTATLEGSQWLQVSVFYGLFGSAAMLILGVPLLLLFTHLRITGFSPFIGAGTMCAWATIALVSGGREPGMLPLFSAVGMFAGLLFRLALFGLRPS